MKENTLFCIEQIKKTDASPQFPMVPGPLSSDVGNAVWLLKGNTSVDSMIREALATF